MDCRCSHGGRERPAAVPGQVGQEVLGHLQGVGYPSEGELITLVHTAGHIPLSLVFGKVFAAHIMQMPRCALYRLYI